MQSEDGYLTDEETTPRSEEGYSDTNSPRGEASLSRREVGRVLDRQGKQVRQVSQAYANAINAASRDTSFESIVKRIQDLVNQFTVDQQVRESIQQEAEALARMVRAAVQKDEGNGVTERDVAIYAVARAVRERGWSFGRVVEKMAAVDRRIAAVDDLRVSVWVGRKPGPQEVVRVGGEPRAADLLRNGTEATWLLRVPAYATDDGKLLEVEGATLCVHVVKSNDGARFVCDTDERRLVRPTAHTAVVKIGQSFEVLRLFKRVEHTLEHASQRSTVVDTLLRRFWVDKLPLTRYLLVNANTLGAFEKRYAELLRDRLDPEKVKKMLEDARKGPKGGWITDPDNPEEEGPLIRTARLLARKALLDADAEVFQALPGHLKLMLKRLVMERGLEKDSSYTGVKGFVVLSELKTWGE